MNSEKIYSESSFLKKSNTSKINIKELLFRYLKKWYWFALSFFVFGVMAYIYLKYTIPQYNVSATIAIAPEENISESGLDVVKELGLFDKTKNKIENEIQVLKSKTLIKRIIEKKKLNIQYFSEGKIQEYENYPKSIIEVNFLAPDSILNTKSKEFFIRINSSLTFSFLTKEGERISDEVFGKKIDTEVGKIVVTPNGNSIKSKINDIIKVKLSPVKQLVESYRKRLQIYTSNQGSSVLHISMNDPIIEKSKDFINMLIDDYGISTIAHKKHISDKRAKFIKDRLNLISADLSAVEDEAAGYKSKFGLTGDVNAQADRVASFDTQTKQEISSSETKLRLIESMENFINSVDQNNNIIPGNLGFNDPSIVNSISRYNSLIVQRKRLLKSSSLINPVIINIDEEIRSIKQGLRSSLSSLKTSVNINLNSLRNTGKYFSGKLYVAPKRQMDLRAIEREQTVKEQLYLFLLQKREEAEITSHITIPNSRVIDRASTYGAYLVSPDRKMAYIVAIFLGFIVPFLSIYLNDLFNTKIKTKEDIENRLSIPLIGTIPKNKVKNEIIVSKNDRSPITESFRILQTNIGFLLTGIKKTNGKVLFVTSTISGEGKTFVSSNLAKVLSVSGNKVIYVGTDFRYPKFHDLLRMPEGKQTEGFTNYITNNKMSEKDVIYTQKGENPMDFLPSGIIPPNPTDLLSNERVKQMFSFLEANYDYIVVDTSPMSLVTDTLLISDIADITIYVVKEGYTDKKLLKYPEKYHADNRLKNMSILYNSEDNLSAYNYGYGE